MTTPPSDPTTVPSQLLALANAMTLVTPPLGSEPRSLEQRMDKFFVRLEQHFDAMRRQMFVEQRGEVFALQSRQHQELRETLAQLLQQPQPQAQQVMESHARMQQDHELACTQLEERHREMLELQHVEDLKTVVQLRQAYQNVLREGPQSLTALLESLDRNAP